MGFKKIRTAPAAPGFDVGDLFIKAERVNVYVLLGIQGCFHLFG